MAEDLRIDDVSGESHVQSIYRRLLLRGNPL
jgi:hypothetical protein